MDININTINEFYYKCNNDLFENLQIDQNLETALMNVDIENFDDDFKIKIKNIITIIVKKRMQKLFKDLFDNPLFEKYCNFIKEDEEEVEEEITFKEKENKIVIE